MDHRVVLLEEFCAGAQAECRGEPDGVEHVDHICAHTPGKPRLTVDVLEHEKVVGDTGAKRVPRAAVNACCI